MGEDFLDKAKENLKIARTSFELECYNASANRAYYAAFQAAIAALAAEGAPRGKNDHAYVQSEFNRRLLKRRKAYPSHLKSYLPKMQQVRNKADYSEKDVGRKVADRQLSRAEEMLRIIGKELGKESDK